MSAYILSQKGVGDGASEAEQQRLKSEFIADFLELQKNSLGAEKFERERDKLAKEGAKLFDLARQGKRQFHELEEQAHVQLIDWKRLEKPLRQWLENEGKGRGWTKEMIENTVNARKREFEHAQAIVKARLEKAGYDEEEAFRERMLNPATRKEAVRYFLHDNTDKAHYLVETIDLLFGEIEKLKRR